MVNELTHPLDIIGVALLLLVISKFSPVTIAIWITIQKFGISLTCSLCIILHDK